MEEDILDLDEDDLLADWDPSVLVQPVHAG